MGWFESSSFKEEDDLITAIKDWLPITVRNRVALGFAFAALVMFLVWNFLPNYPNGETEPDGIVAMDLWSSVFDLDNYIHVIKSPDIDGFMVIAACFSLTQSGLLVLAILPLWKILHSSLYVRLPLAVVNLAGGLLVLWLVFEDGIEGRNIIYLVAMVLLAFSMLSLSVAMFIFKNELGLRHEREVEGLMGGE